jgi:hypothetical protein
MALFGFGRIESQLKKSWPRARACVGPAETEAHVRAAASLACSLYWKPSRCLQRSVVLVRLLRRRGLPAQMVIGYRAVPFFSHAWVEVDGRTVNDTSSYARRLSILHRV